MQNRLEKDKTALSRRKLLGDMGNLAYVASTLTVFSLLGSSARGDTISSPPYPPKIQIVLSSLALTPDVSNAH